ncbi:MAG TPA: HAMP domain-containing sensor histidine kinase [Bacteroidales bacterium]|nr:HAMP domain-containing sensor histidine kinase [Bacteroidales bacterium]
MKLLTKSTYYFFLFSVLAMIASGVLLYFTIKRVIYRQIDNSLITEKTIIQDQIEQSDSIPDFEATFGHQIEVKLLDHTVHNFQSIKDTDIYDFRLNSFLPYRCIFCSGNTGQSKGYLITIFQILSEKEELLKDVSLYMFFLFLLLLLISILINYLIAWRLWRPFYYSVNKASNFNIQSDEPLDLPHTDINEFSRLNTVFSRMTRKMRNDYLNLKEFNENAAHEIQTPLAVIRSKTDLLMQNKNLKKESIDLIKSINDATTKLFRLNQGLLLISKIENQYFDEKGRVSLKQIIENCLDNYKEIMQLKNISTKMEASDDAIIEINEGLADILISNLISNAVRYNIDGGFIKCHVDDICIIFTNSGLPLLTDPEKLFMRFQKGNDNPQSVGLGLSIVKKIVDTYGMKITYSSHDNIHEIKLIYSQNANSKGHSMTIS